MTSGLQQLSSRQNIGQISIDETHFGDHFHRDVALISHGLTRRLSTGVCIPFVGVSCFPEDLKVLLHSFFLLSKECLRVSFPHHSFHYYHNHGARRLRQAWSPRGCIGSARCWEAVQRHDRPNRYGPFREEARAQEKLPLIEHILFRKSPGGILFKRNLLILAFDICNRCVLR